MRFSLLCVLCVGCGTTALYPPRPAAVPGPPLAEPEPSRVVMHATVSSAALAHALDSGVPSTGAGTFALLGSERRFIWQRDPMQVAFQQGRIRVQAHVMATIEVGTLVQLPITLTILAEPVLSSDYRAHLQSLDVQVTSDDPRLRAAQGLAGALDKLRDTLTAKLQDFAYDLKPMITQAHDRIARPIDLPVGDAHGCAELRVVGVEAGPTVLADGVEKDLALVITPSITLPCATAPDQPPPQIPPLANVATLQPGPFVVKVPIAARYEELQQAMSAAFTNGKLYFSKEFPELFMEKPEVYASRDQLVLKLHISGPINKYGIHLTLDGDLFMSGHPQVIDNEIRVPDLEPTIETSSFLLKLKAALDGDSIRQQARDALRLDIGGRLAQVRGKLSSELSFGDGTGCLRAAVNKVEVSGVYPHQSYLRLYVTLIAQASVYLPCPSPPSPAPAVSNR